MAKIRAAADPKTLSDFSDLSDTWMAVDDGSDEAQRLALSEVLGNAVNAIHEGCVANGVTDDRDNLQAAFDKAVSENKPLYLPKGSYRLASEITQTSTNQANWDVVIFGDGEQTQIVLDSNTSFVDFIGENADGAKPATGGIVVQNLRITGNNTGAAGSTITAQHFFRAQYLRDIVLRDLKIENIGERADSVGNSRFFECYNILIENCHFQDNETQNDGTLSFYSCTDVRVVNNILQNVEQSGAKIGVHFDHYAPETFNPGRYVITDNLIAGYDSSGVAIYDSEYIEATVSNNVIHSCGVSGIYSSPGAAMHGKIVIADNHISCCSGASSTIIGSIFAGGREGTSITGNVILDSGYEPAVLLNDDSSANRRTFDNTSTNTTIAPDAGEFRLNNADMSLVTQIAIDGTTNFTSATVGDELRIRSNNDQQRYYSANYRITGVTDNTTWTQYDVAVIESFVTIPDATDCDMLVWTQDARANEGRGVNLTVMDGMVVSDNVIHRSTGTGIHITVSRGVTNSALISGNHISHCKATNIYRGAIFVDFGGNVDCAFSALSITDNVIDQTEYDDAHGFHTLAAGTSYSRVIENLNFSGNVLRGRSAKYGFAWFFPTEISGAIKDNQFYDWGTALSLDNGQDHGSATATEDFWIGNKLVVSGNHFKDCTAAYDLPENYTSIVFDSTYDNTPTGVSGAMQREGALGDFRRSGAPVNLTHYASLADAFDEAQATGQPLYVPPGTHTVTAITETTGTWGDVTVYGDGPQSQLLIDSESTPMFRLDGNGGSRITFDNLRLTGINTDTGLGGGSFDAAPIALLLDDFKHVTVKNCFIDGWGDDQTVVRETGTIQEGGSIYYRIADHGYETGELNTWKIKLTSGAGAGQWRGLNTHYGDADSTTTWQANTVYAIGAQVTPTVSNGRRYVCTARQGDFQSGASEPSWSTTLGNTQTDDQVTWRCIDDHTVSTNPQVAFDPAPSIGDSYEIYSTTQFGAVVFRDCEKVTFTQNAVENCFATNGGMVHFIGCKEIVATDSFLDGSIDTTLPSGSPGSKYGYHMSQETGEPGLLTCSNNVITRLGGGMLVAYSTGDNVDMVSVVSDNVIFDTTNTGIYWAGGSSAGESASKVVIANNYIDSVASKYPNGGIQGGIRTSAGVDGGGTFIIDGNVITNVGFNPAGTDSGADNTGISITDAKEVNVANNIVSNSTGLSLSISTTYRNNCSVNVSNNTFAKSQWHNVYIVGNSGDVLDVNLVGNVCDQREIQGNADAASRGTPICFRRGSGDAEVNLNMRDNMLFAATGNNYQWCPIVYFYGSLPVYGTMAGNHFLGIRDTTGRGTGIKFNDLSGYWGTTDFAVGKGLLIENNYFRDLEAGFTGTMNANQIALNNTFKDVDNPTALSEMRLQDTDVEVDWDIHNAGVIPAEHTPVVVDMQGRYAIAVPGDETKIVGLVTGSGHVAEEGSLVDADLTTAWGSLSEWSTNQRAEWNDNIAMTRLDELGFNIIETNKRVAAPKPFAFIAYPGCFDDQLSSHQPGAQPLSLDSWDICLQWTSKIGQGSEMFDWAAMEADLDAKYAGTTDEDRSKVYVTIDIEGASNNANQIDGTEEWNSVKNSESIARYWQLFQWLKERNATKYNNKFVFGLYPAGEFPGVTPSGYRNFFRMAIDNFRIAKAPAKSSGTFQAGSTTSTLELAVSSSAATGDVVVWPSRSATYGSTGTAQAGGTSTTIRLAAGESWADDEIKGYGVEITSGTGAGQFRRITGYDSSTKDATVSEAWTDIPTNTNGYQVSRLTARKIASWSDPTATLDWTIGSGPASGIPYDLIAKANTHVAQTEEWLTRYNTYEAAKRIMIHADYVSYLMIAKTRPQYETYSEWTTAQRTRHELQTMYDLLKNDFPNKPIHLETRLWVTDDVESYQEWSSSGHPGYVGSSDEGDYLKGDRVASGSTVTNNDSLPYRGVFTCHTGHTPTANLDPGNSSLDNAAPTTWSDEEDYVIGDSVVLSGATKVYTALAASGPGGAGAYEPGVTSGWESYWVSYWYATKGRYPDANEMYELLEAAYEIMDGVWLFFWGPAYPDDYWGDWPDVLTDTLNDFATERRIGGGPSTNGVKRAITSSGSGDARNSTSARAAFNIPENTSFYIGGWVRWTGEHPARQYADSDLRTHRFVRKEGSFDMSYGLLGSEHRFRIVYAGSDNHDQWFPALGDAPGDWDDGNWHHFVFGLKYANPAFTAIAYVDGTEELNIGGRTWTADGGSDSNDLILIGSTSPLPAGWMLYDWRLFVGTADDTSELVTEAEALAWYQTGAEPALAPEAWYPFNDLDGSSTILDISGNNHDLTLTGGSVISRDMTLPYKLPPAT